MPQFTPPTRLWPRLRRLWRHLWADPATVPRHLGAGALDRLTERVRRSETHHRGEIRLCVEAGLPWSYLRRGAAPRERALMLFGKLRVWDTEANNGVLIYLLLADRAVEIVADRGLNAQVDAAQWQAIVAAMRPALAAGRFEDGLAQAIDAIDTLLQQHFPCADADAPPDHNELPDAPALL